MMKEDLVDDPKSWDASTWENDQERLRVLENRVKAYLLDIERRYKVRFIFSDLENRSHFDHKQPSILLKQIILTLKMK